LGRFFESQLDCISLFCGMGSITLGCMALCGVCGGSGAVILAHPIYACAFCGGTGVFPRSRLTFIGSLKRCGD
jgi:DnaJ-class molecular chaperone